MLRPMELRRFRKWMRDNVLSADEKWFVNLLTPDELQAAARYLVNRGVVLVQGVPQDAERAEKYLSGAILTCVLLVWDRLFGGKHDPA